MHAIGGIFGQDLSILSRQPPQIDHRPTLALGSNDRIDLGDTCPWSFDEVLTNQWYPTGD